MLLAGAPRAHANKCRKSNLAAGLQNKSAYKDFFILEKLRLIIFEGCLSNLHIFQFFRRFDAPRTLPDAGNSGKNNYASRKVSFVAPGGMISTMDK